MARVAMTGTAAADPVADGAGAQAPATVVPPGMRSGPWNSYDRAQLQDAVLWAGAGPPGGTVRRAAVRKRGPGSTSLH